MFLKCFSVIAMPVDDRRQVEAFGQFSLGRETVMAISVRALLVLVLVLDRFRSRA